MIIFSIEVCFDFYLNCYLGNFESAIEQFFLAEEVLLQNGGSENPRLIKLLVFTYKKLGDTLKSTDRLDDSLSYLFRCLHIQHSSYADALSVGSTHLKICSTFARLYRFHDALNHAEVARDLGLERLDELKRTPGTDLTECCILIALARYNAALQYHKSGHYRESVNEMKEALVGSVLSLGESHPISELIKIKSERMKVHLPPLDNQTPPPMYGSSSSRLPVLKQNSAEQKNNLNSLNSLFVSNENRQSGGDETQKSQYYNNRRYPNYHSENKIMAPSSPPTHFKHNKNIHPRSRLERQYLLEEEAKKANKDNQPLPFESFEEKELSRQQLQEHYFALKNNQFNQKNKRSNSANNNKKNFLNPANTHGVTRPMTAIGCSSGRPKSAILSSRQTTAASSPTYFYPTTPTTPRINILKEVYGNHSVSNHTEQPLSGYQTDSLLHRGKPTHDNGDRLLAGNGMGSQVLKVIVDAYGNVLSAKKSTQTKKKKKAKSESPSRSPNEIHKVLISQPSNSSNSAFRKKNVRRSLVSANPKDVSFTPEVGSEKNNFENVNGMSENEKYDREVTVLAEAEFRHIFTEETQKNPTSSSSLHKEETDEKDDSDKEQDIYGLDKNELTEKLYDVTVREIVDDASSIFHGDPEASQSDIRVEDDIEELVEEDIPILDDATESKLDNESNHNTFHEEKPQMIPIEDYLALKEKVAKLEALFIQQTQESPDTPPYKKSSSLTSKQISHNSSGNSVFQIEFKPVNNGNEEQIENDLQCKSTSFLQVNNGLNKCMTNSSLGGGYQENSTLQQEEREEEQQYDVVPHTGAAMSDLPFISEVKTPSFEVGELSCQQFDNDRNEYLISESVPSYAEHGLFFVQNVFSNAIISNVKRQDGEDVSSIQQVEFVDVACDVLPHNLSQNMQFDSRPAIILNPPITQLYDENKHKTHQNNLMEKTLGTSYASSVGSILKDDVTVLLPFESSATFADVGVVESSCISSPVIAPADDLHDSVLEKPESFASDPSVISVSPTSPHHPYLNLQNFFDRANDLFSHLENVIIKGNNQFQAPVVMAPSSKQSSPTRESPSLVSHRKNTFRVEQHTTAKSVPTADLVISAPPIMPPQFPAVSISSKSIPSPSASLRRLKSGGSSATSSAIQRQHEASNRITSNAIGLNKSTLLVGENIEFEHQPVMEAVEVMNEINSLSSFPINYAPYSASSTNFDNNNIDHNINENKVRDTIAQHLVSTEEYSDNDTEEIGSTLEIQNTFREEHVRKNTPSAIHSSNVDDHNDGVIGGESLQFSQCSSDNHQLNTNEENKDETEENNKTVSNFFIEEQEATLKIQSIFRGRKARVQISKMKSNQSPVTNDDITVQTSAANVSDNHETAIDLQDETMMNDEQNQAALKLQSVFRGKRSRNEINAKKSNLNNPTFSPESTLSFENQESELNQSIFVTTDLENSQILKSNKDEEVVEAADLLTEQQNQTEAALKLQALFRGKKVRDELVSMKNFMKEESDDKENEE